jgi:hypothetical protein
MTELPFIATKTKEERRRRFRKRCYSVRWLLFFPVEQLIELFNERREFAVVLFKTAILDRPARKMHELLTRSGEQGCSGVP